MQNQFLVENYPDAIPATLGTGARWAWKCEPASAAYPASSYTLEYRFNEQGEPFGSIAIAAGKDGDTHIFEASQAQTSEYNPGGYLWQAVIVRDSDGEELIIDRGHVDLLPDFGSNPGQSGSWVYQVLVAVRATILGTASEKQSGYSIGGRSLSLRTPNELIELEREFAQRWEKEKDAVERAAGRSTGGRVLVKMSA